MRNFYGESSRSESSEGSEAHRDGLVESQPVGLNVHPDELGPVYWDHSAQNYTDEYHSSFPQTDEATWITESNAPGQIQAKIDSIVWDLAGRDMIIHEQVYRDIVYAICANESELVSGVLRNGGKVHFSIGGWSEDAWAHRIKYISPFGDALQCQSSCPLRDYRQQPADPALNPVSDSATARREDACSKLYGKIRAWHTRILILELGVFETQLKARLDVAILVCVPGIVLCETHELIQFTALSYIWGATVFPRLISINGVSFPITENLFAYLQRCRNETKLTYLWIDAICINQLDLDEKAMQIKNMLTIYGKAQNVTVWLGEETQYTKLAVTYIEWAYLIMQEYRNVEANVRLDQFAVVDPRHVWHSSECAQHFSSVVSALEDLCNRNWIRRIWIRQEVWAANKIEVRCGSTVFSWDVFLFAAQTHLRSRDTNCIVPSLTEEHISCFKYLQRRKEINEDPVSDSAPTLLNDEPCEILVLLNESIPCQFTVQHDLIYSLLGMASTPRSQPYYDHVPEVRIRIDYQHPIESTFRELAMAIMHVAGPHSILATSPRQNEHIPLALPTWVPDFRNGHHCEFQGHLGGYAPPLYKSRFNRTRFIESRAQQASELLGKFRLLNPEVRSTELLPEGLCVGELTGESPQPESYWQVCLIETADDRSYNYIIYETSTTRRSWYQRGSKPMAYQLYDWFIDIHDRKPDKGGSASRRRSKFPNFRVYSRTIATMNVPVSAAKGGLIVLIPLLATPLILRKLPRHPRSVFHFIGCAWLYDDEREAGGCEKDDSARSVMKELNSVEGLFASSPLFKDRLEIFTIE